MEAVPEDVGSSYRRHGSSENLRLCIFGFGGFSPWRELHEPPNGVVASPLDPHLFPQGSDATPFEDSETISIPAPAP